MDSKELDCKARKAAKEYKALEQKLLGLIIKIDQSKAFYRWGYSSLFQYSTEALELSPAIASAFINVARKAQQVPELEKQVESGKLSIYKAQRITSVLTPENSKTWFDLAQKKTHRELEREVAIASPAQVIKEKARYLPFPQNLSEKVIIKREVPRLELRLGISEKLMLEIRRAQDLESQRLRKNLNLEETLTQVMAVYLNKKDPLKKALRQKCKGSFEMGTNNKCHGVEKNSARAKQECHGIEKNSARAKQECHGIEKNSARAKQECHGIEKNSARAKQECHGVEKNTARAKEECRDVEKNTVSAKKIERKPLPAKVRHHVQIRDESRCTHVDSKGKRCSSRRFLEIHHTKPVSLGGDNSFSNLRLLCSGHHKAIHKT